MGKLICLVGKSGSGKDTLFKSIINDSNLQITPIIPCTTRPKRKNEIDGIDYHFVSRGDLRQAELKNEVIEKRAYHTVKGVWHYFTKSFDLGDSEKFTIIITTPTAIKKLSNKFSKRNIIIVYLEADDLTRIKRCLQREELELHPNYEEVCRRYLADEHDFASFADEDLGSYYSCYKIDSNKPISDCKKQFVCIYRTIVEQTQISKEKVLKSIAINESHILKLCNEYINSSHTEYPDFNSYFEAAREVLY